MWSQTVLKWLSDGNISRVREFAGLRMRTVITSDISSPDNLVVAFKGWKSGWSSGSLSISVYSPVSAVL